MNFALGEDVPLHLIVRDNEDVLVVNDRRDGIWGREMRVPLPLARPRALPVTVEFRARGLRISVPGTDPVEIDDRFIISGAMQAKLPPAISLRGEATVPADDAFLRAFDDQPQEESAGIAGYVDYFGAVPSLGGVIFGGWLREPWVTGARSIIVARFDGGEIACDVANKVFVAWHDRADLGELGVGFVLFMPGAVPEEAERAGLKQLRLRLEDGRWRDIVPSPGLAPGDEKHIVQVLRDSLLNARGNDLAQMQALLRRPIYAGHDTLGPMGLPVHVEVDEVVEVKPGAAILMGWQLDPQDMVTSVHLRNGAFSSPPLAGSTLVMPRNDIVEAFSARYGISDNRLGFIAYADTGATRADSLFLEIRLASGKIAFKPLPAPVRSGIAAIRRVLGAAAVPSDELQHVYDKVLGPSVVEMNRRRLARPMHTAEARFGTLPALPRASLVIPLYGRLDFMRYQLALFSAGGLAQDEIIYVLDEPSRKSELLDMAHAAHDSFRVPFRILLPAENRGFGPASNIGLREAGGQYVCFLNSDVFPADTRFFDRLVEDLEATPDLGAVGGTLLFADGSVQHGSMDYEPLAQLGNWLFPMHPGKGRVPAAPTGRLTYARAITGACMLLSRDLALRLGGFDQDYVIGDFEDADLCQRIARDGLRCAVDTEARAYHLERQSQGDSANNWRRNVTLLNAWTFNRRYRSSLTGLPEAAAPARGDDRRRAAGKRRLSS